VLVVVFVEDRLAGRSVAVAFDGVGLAGETRVPQSADRPRGQGRLEEPPSAWPLAPRRWLLHLIGHVDCPLQMNGLIVNPSAPVPATGAGGEDTPWETDCKEGNGRVRRHAMRRSRTICSQPRISDRLGSLPWPRPTDHRQHSPKAFVLNRAQSLLSILTVWSS